MKHTAAEEALEALGEHVCKGTENKRGSEKKPLWEGYQDPGPRTQLEDSNELKKVLDLCSIRDCHFFSHN